MLKWPYLVIVYSTGILLALGCVWWCLTPCRNCYAWVRGFRRPPDASVNGGSRYRYGKIGKVVTKIKYLQ